MQTPKGPQGETDNRRLILAVALSGVVLVVWNLLFPPPPPVEKPPVDAPSAPAVEGPASDVAAQPGEATPAVAIERRVIAQLEEQHHHRVAFTNDDGQIAAWWLTEPQYENTHDDGRKTPFEFVADASTLVGEGTDEDGDGEGDKAGVFEPPLLQLALGGQATHGEYTVVEQGPRALTLGWTDPATGVKVTRHYRLDERGYTLSTDLRLENPGAAPVDFDLTALFRGVQDDSKAKGNLFMPPVYLFESVCEYEKGFERMPASEIRERLEDGDDVSFSNGVRWAGVDNRYFMTALLAAPELIEACTAASDHDGLDQGYTRLRSTIDLVGGQIPAGGEITRTLTYYAGPKKLSELQQTSPKTSDAIDFGFFSAICVPMLWLMRQFHTFVGNWGVAIILLTVLVKLITLPLTLKQYKSMAAMKKVQPQMKALQEKYKEDKVKLQQEMMALYREKKINPLAGCLPMVLMMPIYFSLYRTIYSAVELYRADFALWLTDLSASDPTFVTPLLLGVLMLVQMKLNPSAGEQMQQKIIMYVMPVMFTAMMLFLPSGLVIYILVNTVLGIAQQMYMLKQQDDDAPPAGKSGRPVQPARA